MGVGLDEGERDSEPASQGQSRPYESTHSHPSLHALYRQHTEIQTLEGGVGTTGNALANLPHHAEYASSPTGFAAASKSPSSALVG